MTRNNKNIFAGVLGLIALGAPFAQTAQAKQGSRRDDVVFNALGRPMAGATVRVCTANATGQPCSPLAQVYSDAALTQALADPLTTDGLGNYTFYAAPGRYMIEISGPGIATKQLPNVILPSDPSSPTFATVTTTSGISAFSLSLTGNLTVNGSTAVAGTLSVGGAPVPSTNADNQWTAAQRFAGPVPYSDITALGACSALTSFTAPTGTISSGSHTLAIASAQDFANGCGVMVEGAGPTSTLATPTAVTAVSHRTTGSTTIKYCVVAIEDDEGYSACSTPYSFTTSDLYANLTISNYNFISATVPFPVIMGCVYSDQGAGGTFASVAVPIGCTAPYGTSFGFDDWGVVKPVPAFLPAHPPASDGPSGLFTKIDTGGGTTTLTVHDAASNTASSQLVFHDESAAFSASVQQQYTGTNGGQGYVLIPQGNYYLARIVNPFGASTINTRVKQVGTVSLADMPLDFGISNYLGESWDGENGSAPPPQFAPWSSAGINGNSHIPFIIGDDALDVSHITLQSVYGDGILMTYGSGRADHISVIGQGSGTFGNSTMKGCPFRATGAIIGLYVDHFVFAGNAASNTNVPSAICFNYLNFNMGGSITSFTDGVLVNSAVYFDAAASLMGVGNLTENNVWKNIFTENTLARPSGAAGFLTIDSGLASVTIGPPIMESINSDTTRLSGGQAHNILCIDVSGSCVQGGFINAGDIPLHATSGDGSLSTEEQFLSGGGETNFGETHSALGFPMNSYPRGHYSALGGTANLLGSSYGAASPGNASDVAGAMLLIPPFWASAPSASGGGSMAAGVYCYKASAMDPSGGESAAGLEQCLTVGASGKVTIGMQNLLNAASRCYRIYRTAVNGGAGNENVYLNVNASCGGSSINASIFDNAGGGPIAITDTGALTYTAGAPKTSSNGYSTVFNFDNLPSWIMTGPTNGAQPLGIGTTCQDVGVNTCVTDGVKLDVAGGIVRNDIAILVKPIAVASLPAAAAGNAGQWRTVNNSTAVTVEGQTCVGGSTHTAAAFSDGTVWKCF